MSRIKTKRQAKTIRVGLERGSADAFVIEKTGGWWAPFSYLILGSNRASVMIDGKQKFFNFDLFGSAWQRGFDVAFESRCAMIEPEQRELYRAALIREHHKNSRRSYRCEIAFCSADRRPIE